MDEYEKLELILDERENKILVLFLIGIIPLIVGGLLTILGIVGLTLTELIKILQDMRPQLAILTVGIFLILVGSVFILFGELLEKRFITKYRGKGE